MALGVKYVAVSAVMQLKKMGRGQTSLGNWTLEETLLFEVPATLRDSAACAEIC